MKPLTFRQWVYRASRSHETYEFECDCCEDLEDSYLKNICIIGCRDCDGSGIVEIAGIDARHEGKKLTEKMYTKYLLKDAQDLDAYIGNQSGTTLTAMGYGYLLGSQS